MANDVFSFSPFTDFDKETRNLYWQGVELRAKAGNLPDFLRFCDIAYLLGYDPVAYFHFIWTEDLAFHPVVDPDGVPFCKQGRLTSQHIPFDRSDKYGVNKHEFKRYLIEKKQWPVNDLLANWWTGDEEPQQIDIPTPDERPQLKEAVAQIGETLHNRSYISVRQRKKDYFAYIWGQYGDNPNAEDFLKRLRNDGFINPLDNPFLDRELAPIYKIDIRKGVWLTYEELTNPETEPYYTFKTITNNCNTKWKRELKKGKKEANTCKK